MNASTEALLFEKIDEILARLDRLDRAASHDDGERAERPSPAMPRKLQRLAQLLEQLADEEPGERAHVIQERLGLSKSTYYRMVAQLQSHAVPDFPKARGTGDC